MRTFEYTPDALYYLDLVKREGWNATTEDDRARNFWESIASDDGFENSVANGYLRVERFVDGVTSQELHDLTLREFYAIKQMWEDLDPWY